MGTYGNLTSLAASKYTSEFASDIMSYENPDYCKYTNSDSWKEKFSSLFLSSEYSDISFIVEGLTIHAHKLVLALQSEYFNQMLFGGLKESNSKEIPMSQETPHDAFVCILEYFYTNEINFKSKTEDTVVDILLLSDKYELLEVEKATLAYVKNVLL